MVRQESVRARLARGVARAERWLTPALAWRCGIVAALMFGLLLALDVVRHTEAGVLDRSGEQLARDFIDYWAGAKLASMGEAVRAYQTPFFHDFEKSLVGAAAEFKIYGYPPPTMLLCWPLAPLPFVPALLVWVAAGIALCAWPLSRIAGWRAASLAVAA